MNKSILLPIATVLLFASAASAQPMQRNNGGMATPRTIEVTGTAEVEAIPDNVCVVVDLCGFAQPGDDGTAVSIDDAEADLLKQLENLGVSRDAVVEREVPDRPVHRFDERIRRDVMVADRKDRFNRQPQRRQLPDSVKKYDRHSRPKAAPRMMRQGMRSYEITLNSFDMVGKIKEAVKDNKTVVRVEVAEMSCSNIEEYLKQARVEAFIDAKANATALADAAGVKLGDVVNIVVAPSHERRGDTDRRNGVVKVRSKVSTIFAIK